MNISDLYTINNCLRNADIRTYNCGYFPVAISRPREIITISGLNHDKLPAKISVTNKIVSLKLYYAIQLLLITICAFKDRYSSPFLMKWVPGNESFNRLSYIHESTDDQIAAFYEMLKIFCSSGMVRVSEGSFFSTNYKVKNEYFTTISLSNEVSPTVNIIIDTENVDETYREGDLLDSERYKQKDVSYKWEEIKDYFVTLSLLDMELLHGQEINRYAVKDDSLFTACENLDIGAIKSAIQDGANIFALNKDGESPIYKCVEAIQDFYLDELDVFGKSELKSRISKMKECIDYLISQGADINSYGFGCLCSPLCESEDICDVGVMEFLLNRGANPNYNTNFEDMCIMRDEWYIKSSVLSMVSDSISVYGEEYSEVQEKLLLSHGAQMYIDGFNPETGTMEENYVRV